MGNTIAKNTVTQSIKVMNDVITSSTNECTNTVNTGSYLIITGGNSDSCQVTSNTTVTVSVDTSCLASTQIQNQISNDLAQSAKLQAEAVNQQFALGTFAEGINLSSAYLSLANEMNTAFYNSCVTEITSNQVTAILCQGSSNMSVDTNYDNTIKDTQNCVFNNSSVTNTANKITQSIASSASAVITNFLAQVIFAIAAVIIGAAIFLFLILLIMKAGKKPEPVVAGEETGPSNQGEDVIALAATLTGKSPTQIANMAQTSSVVKGAPISTSSNPMSFLVKT